MGNDTLWGGDGNDVLDGGTEVAGTGLASGAVDPESAAGSGPNPDMVLGSVSSDSPSLGSPSPFVGNDPGNAGNDILNGAGGQGTSVDDTTGDTAGYMSVGWDGVAGDTTGVTVNLTLQGQAQDTVHAGWDTLNNIQNLIGSNYDDHLIGDSNANILWGADGNDVMNGATGNDTLYGGAGNDQIHGGAGSDQIIGGAGNDVLWGGTAAPTAVNTTGGDVDTFYFGNGSGHDVIMDFNVTNDVLAFTWSGGVYDGIHVSNNADGVLFYDGDGTHDSVLVEGAGTGVGGVLQISDIFGPSYSPASSYNPGQLVSADGYGADNFSTAAAPLPPSEWIGYHGI